MNIQDVSPQRAHTSGLSNDHSTTGRMVSIVCTGDGQTLFSGSFANVWRSGDGGQTWDQLTWPQPAEGQFGVPGSLGGWLALDLGLWDGWSVAKHPRFLANLTKDQNADIVGFWDGGIWTAIGNGNGTFQTPQFVVANLGFVAGGWQVDKHPRFVVDLTGDGLADVVGFGIDGIWTALGKGDGTFTTPQLVVQDFGYVRGGGGWRSIRASWRT
jgi:hypothetical protein